MDRARRLQARYVSTPAEISSQIADASSSASTRAALLDDKAHGAIPDRGGRFVQGARSADTRGVLRGKAEEVLAKSDPAEAVEFLSKSAGSGDIRDRQRAVKVLGSIGTPESGNGALRVNRSSAGRAARRRGRPGSVRGGNETPRRIRSSVRRCRSAGLPTDPPATAVRCAHGR